MRHLHVCHILTLTRLGGVETLLESYLANRKDPRLRHFVLATSAIPELVQAVEATCTPVFVPRRSFHYDPRALWHMADWLRQNRIDLVHTYNWAGNVWGGLTAQFAGVRLRITGQYGTLLVENPPRLWLETLSAHRSQLTIVNSAFLEEIAIKQYKLPSSQVRVVYGGVDFRSPHPPSDIRRELGIPDDWLVVGSVARLSLPKNLAVLIQAARLVLLRRPDTAFVLVGGGPMETEVRELVRKYHIEDRFVLTGWRRDIPNLLATFDVFTLCSAWESLPYALIEAGCAGLPIVAPAIAGIPEIIAHDQTGILLTPTEPFPEYRNAAGEPIPRVVSADGKLSPPLSLHPRVYADALLHLLERPKERERLGNAAHEEMRRRFSIHQYVAQVESAYVELAEQHHIDL